jgi:hypothetical protein
MVRQWREQALDWWLAFAEDESAEGRYILVALARSRAGRIARTAYEFGLDLFPPRIVPSVVCEDPRGKGENGWCPGAARADFRGFDTPRGSGVAHIALTRPEGRAIIIEGDGATHFEESDGVFRLSARATDRAHRDSEPTVVELRIDRRPPDLRLVRYCEIAERGSICNDATPGASLIVSIGTIRLDFVLRDLPADRETSGALSVRLVGGESMDARTSSATFVLQFAVPSLTLEFIGRDRAGNDSAPLRITLMRGT